MDRIAYLTKICRENGYCWEIQYSEVENVYYGSIMNYLAKPSLLHEVKRVFRLEDLVEYMIERLNA